MDSPVMKRFPAVLALVLFSGCLSLSAHRLRADNRNQMLSAVTHRIPTGTPLAEARKKMEAAGFKCEAVTHASFSEDPGFVGSDRDKYRFIQDASFLQCTKTESAGFLVSHIWTVALVANESDKVEDVLVLHQMEGP